MITDHRLDQAMKLFWRRGYFDTSVEELGARTGLHRAAIYSEFGSKQRLFEALLGRFRERVTARKLAPLEARGAGLAEVEQFFNQFRDMRTKPDGRLGCLMCLTAAEVSPVVPSVARIVSAYLVDLRALFTRACRNARSQGELARRIDEVKVADYLTGAVLGLMALARSPAPSSAVANYVDGVLSYLHNLKHDLKSNPRRENA
jgi:TetR/AcrR family transcriptional repressor of nem operon